MLHLDVNIYHLHGKGGIIFSSVCVFVRLLVCQQGNSCTVTEIITKFLGHYPMVERANKFENG